MNEENQSNEVTRGHKRLGEYRIPGLEVLAHKITAASTKGALFSLAEEIDLLLADYLKKKGKLPTSMELEAIILQAAQVIIGK